jgi:hypothetical protein
MHMQGETRHGITLPVQLDALLDQITSMTTTMNFEGHSGG